MSELTEAIASLRNELSRMTAQLDADVQAIKELDERIRAVQIDRGETDAAIKTLERRRDIARAEFMANENVKDRLNGRVNSSWHSRRQSERRERINQLQSELQKLLELYHSQSGEFARLSEALRACSSRASKARPQLQRCQRKLARLELQFDRIHRPAK